MKYDMAIKADAKGKLKATLTKSKDFPKMSGPLSPAQRLRAKEIFHALKESPDALDFLVNYIAHTAYANGFADATNLREDTID